MLSHKHDLSTTTEAQLHFFVATPSPAGPGTAGLHPTVAPGRAQTLPAERPTNRRTLRP